MATLVLGVLGRAVLGPVGGLVGTLLGAGVDRRLAAGGRRESGRLPDPRVQAASYGTPLPIVHGRMRTAGTLIWSSGIREQAQRSGGGKRGPATVSYSYSASFAVALAARPVAALGRIWADGRLLRDAGGQWLGPVVMRLHEGHEDQPVDPLIAAAEGVAGTPAYRGLAYAVFEDLPLADYGNRIPLLNFELIADAGPLDLGETLATVAASAGTPVATRGTFPAIDGAILNGGQTLADSIAPFAAVAGAALVPIPALTLAGAGATPLTLPSSDRVSPKRGGGAAGPRHERQGAGAVPDGIELAFFDTSRDFEPGLQRCRHGSGRTEAVALPCALAPPAAKGLAAALLARRRAARVTTTLLLPWRHLGVQPGDRVRLDDEGGLWRVRELRFEGHVLGLDLERDGPIGGFGAADGGRLLVFGDAAPGPTTLHILDLPLLPDEAASGPRLWLAAAGGSPGWRQATVSLSRDGGAGFVPVARPGPTIMGTTLTALPLGPADRWDRFGTVDVMLLRDDMWLESRAEAAVLEGANLALIGEELIQFRQAQAVGPRRFRLSGLLRGRRGTEAAIAAHAAAEPFVLVDQTTMVAVPAEPERLGATWLFGADGAGDPDAPVVPVILGGRAMMPLSVAHLEAVSDGADLVLRWVRRSRSGFGWPDLVDAPLDETVERYRVEVQAGAGIVRTVDVDGPAWVYGAEARQVDRAGAGAGPSFATVRQLGRVIGAPATLPIDL